MSKDKLKTQIHLQVDKAFRHVRQGSYKTRERYKAAAYRFVDFCVDEFHLQKAANISGKHLEQYVRYMRDEKQLAPSTIKTELSGVRFFHDCIPTTKHPLPDNDHFDLERRQRRGKNRTWTPEEFKNMVDAAEETGRDDYGLALHLALHMGLRIHEAFRIDTATARNALKYGVLEIKGKGGRVRRIPLHSAVEEPLRAKMATTLTGQKLLVKEEQLTHNAIKDLQEFIANHRPDNHGITFHGLRHNYSCDCYRRLRGEGKSHDAARRQISEWLGHSRLEVVDIYLSGLGKEELR